MSARSLAAVMERCQGALRLQDLVQQRPAAALTFSEPIAPAQRQRDELVAAAGDAPAQARCPRRRTRARRRAAVVGRGRRRRPARSRARRSRRSTSSRRAAGLEEEVGEVAHARDAQVLDGAGRGPADRRRDLGGAPLADHDAARADALGGAADRAEVLRDPGPRRARRSAAASPREQLAASRRRDSRRPRRRRPGARASRSARSIARPRPIARRRARRARARARRARSPRSRRRRGARRPRSASRTALRP